MEEADKGWLMISIGEWVNVSSGTVCVCVRACVRVRACAWYVCVQ